VTECIGEYSNKIGVAVIVVVVVIVVVWGSGVIVLGGVGGGVVEGVGGGGVPGVGVIVAIVGVIVVEVVYDNHTNSAKEDDHEINDRKHKCDYTRGKVEPASQEGNRKQDEREEDETKWDKLRGTIKEQ